MRFAGFGWRRLRARLGLVALLAGMSALIVIALAGTLGYLDVAATGGVRDAIAASPPSARVLQVQTRQADDSDAQRADAADILDDLLPDDALTWTAIRTPPVALAEREERVVMVVDEALADHAVLEAGDWPDAPSQTTLHADAAAALGLSPGDTIQVTAEDTSADLEVVGLWRPADPEDSHWAGDSTVESGLDPLNVNTVGPAVVLPETLEALDLAPFVQWTITPGPDLAPETVQRWLRALPAVEGAFEEAGIEVRGITTTGTLATTLADAQESLASVRAASAIPMLILAVISVIALWQIATLLATLRERENQVLRSRGGSVAQIVSIGAAEAAAVALGALGGGVALMLVLGNRPGFRPTTTVLVTCAVVVVVMAVLVGVAVVAARRGLRTTGETGRARGLVTSGTMLLVVAAAAFGLWRFSRNSSPLVPGTQRIDLIAVGGPALGLVAVALVTVAVSAPLSRGLASLARRRPGFSPVTELRQASRRVAVTAVPVILIVLAAAVGTIASGYAGTWQALRTASSEVSLGGDVRVNLAGGVVGDRSQEIDELAAGTGADAASGVLETALRLDDQVGALTALPMSAVDASSAPAELLDPAVTALSPAADPLPGIDLPPDAAEMALTVTASANGQVNDVGQDRDATIFVWLRRGSDLVRLNLGAFVLRAADDERFDEELQEVVTVPDPEAGQPRTTELTSTLPAGQWRIVAVDAELQTSFDTTSWSLAIEEIAVDGADVLAGSDLEWDPDVLPMPGDDGGYVSEGAMAFSAIFAGNVYDQGFLLDTLTVQRFMPVADDDAGAVVPVVTSPGWSDAIRPDGTDVLIGTVAARVEQVGTIPVVPGNSDPAAALADLPTLQNVLLRHSEDVLDVNQIWLSTLGDPQDLGDAVRDTLPSSASVDVIGDGVTDAVAAPGRTVYWVAAAGALLLALPAIAAVAMTQAAGRRGEVVVLRAVGVSARAQGRSRARELLGLELGAIVVGVLAGWALCAVVMIPLVRSTAPQVSSAVPLALTFDWVPGLALMGVIAVAAAVVALWYGARVRGQARDTTWREEIR